MFFIGPRGLAANNTVLTQYCPHHCKFYEAQFRRSDLTDPWDRHIKADRVGRTFVRMEQRRNEYGALVKKHTRRDHCADQHLATYVFMIIVLIHVQYRRLNMS